MNKRWNWNSCNKLALSASWTHGLIAHSVIASGRNSVVVDSNPTQFNFLKLLQRILQWWITLTQTHRHTYTHTYIYICMYIYIYIHIERERERVVDTFSLFSLVTISSRYCSIPLTLVLIRRTGGLRTFCQCCWFDYQLEMLKSRMDGVYIYTYIYIHMYIFMYIYNWESTLFSWLHMLLWDLSTLYVVDDLWPLMT